VKKRNLLFRKNRCSLRPGTQRGGGNFKKSQSRNLRFGKEAGSGKEKKTKEGVTAESSVRDKRDNRGTILVRKRLHKGELK